MEIAKGTAGGVTSAGGVQAAQNVIWYNYDIKKAHHLDGLL
jgi:hypothetical protein